ncbi:GlcG/HbpS family heme-binding protein [Oceanicoccus sagamiensis]|uniref:GlcG protein n=1 Tax=Oceanicoccus sagamiensis TaxID=716816 RepID=A0A1X9N6B3_9GAMM|nr:heme-binding protein [Oceanicoccus sagamiensis]ARN72801.1 hypothetical protein BST96_00955 [Oceanicoccus sagamiensis]
MTRQTISSVLMALILIGSTVAWAKNEPSRMTYAMAATAMDAAEAYARNENWRVTILITDQHANPVMLRRIDGASHRSFGFATSKALVVTQTGLSSGEYGEKLKAGEIQEIDGGTHYKGGVPIYSGEQLLGSITVSGVRDFQDEEVAIAGAKTIGTTTQSR